MNPDHAEHPRPAMEARITSLLLGELTPQEALEVRQAIEQNPEWARLHEQLKRTIELVREAVGQPATETAALPASLRLSDARRERLLTQFKVLRLPQVASSGRQRISWHVPMAIAASLILLLSVTGLHLADRLSYPVTRRIALGIPRSQDVDVLGAAPATEVRRAPAYITGAQPTTPKPGGAESPRVDSGALEMREESARARVRRGETLVALPGGPPAALAERLAESGRYSVGTAGTTSTAARPDGVSAESSRESGQEAEATPRLRFRYGLLRQPPKGELEAFDRRGGPPATLAAPPTPAKEPPPAPVPAPPAAGRLSGGYAFPDVAQLNAPATVRLGVAEQEGQSAAKDDLVARLPGPQAEGWQLSAGREGATATVTDFALLHDESKVKSAPESREIERLSKQAKAADTADKKVATKFRVVLPREPEPSKGVGVRALDEAQDVAAPEGEPTVVRAKAPAPEPQPEVETADAPFSTFSLNVTDVSFKLAASSLENGLLPEPATVRSEEFINAFGYRDPEPPPGARVGLTWERARYPFTHNREVVRLAVRTGARGREAGRALNVVLLLDNSGSMERADRVRIIREALAVLAKQLQPQDRISVVAFARTARLWVDGLTGAQAGELVERVGNLSPEGGTNLEDALRVGYETALRHFVPQGNNRVVLLTDGAANLGDVDPESLKRKVEAFRRQGIALDCFGIGWEGYHDELLATLSRNADGRYGFINTPEAAATQFAGQLAGALQVAAADVKVQVEFNPQRVSAYRQIGYAKHQLTKEQFRDHTVDAAELGAAEAGNALYLVQVDPRGSGELGWVRVRYRVPGTGEVEEREWPLVYDGPAAPLAGASPALRLATVAAAFAEWLVSSPYAAEITTDQLLGHLSGVADWFGQDPRPNQLEWMIRQAKAIAGR